MQNITVYEKPTCTTCRKTIKMLNEMGVEFEKVNYYIKPFTKNKLKTLLKKELDIKNNNYTETQILNFMIADHNLIQRPIIEKGDKAVLGRPVETIRELFWFLVFSYSSFLLN